MRNISVSSMALALAVVNTPMSNAGADDVYNFYFQKGGAPQNVIQGGAGQTAQRARQAEPPPVPESESPVEEAPSVAAPSAPAAMATQLRPIKKDDPEFKNFYVTGGMTHLSDKVGTGRAYTLGAQYNFNRYLGARLQGQFLAPENAHYEDDRIDRDSRANRWGGQASLVFTPIRMQILGHRFLDISAHAGLMSQRQLVAAGAGSLSENQVRTAVRPFVGASALVTLNENFGVEGFAALQEGGGLSRLGANLVFQF